MPERPKGLSTGIQLRVWGWSQCRRSLTQSIAWLEPWTRASNLTSLASKAVMQKSEWSFAQSTTEWFPQQSQQLLWMQSALRRCISIGRTTWATLWSSIRDAARRWRSKRWVLCPTLTHPWQARTRRRPARWSPNPKASSKRQQSAPWASKNRTSFTDFVNGET